MEELFKPHHLLTSQIFTCYYHCVCMCAYTCVSMRMCVHNIRIMEYLSLSNAISNTQVCNAISNNNRWFFFYCLMCNLSLNIILLNVCTKHCIFAYTMCCYTQVSGEMVGTGTDMEPLLLHITYPGSDGITTRELSSGFSKLTTINQMKV